MKPLLEKVCHSDEASFSFLVHQKKQLDYPWHFHPEYQLNYVVHGKGQRLIGDHLSNFTTGDLIVVGNGLSHYWQYDPEYFTDENPGKAVVIHFANDFLGSGLFEKPEFRRIKKMLAQSSRGIYFTDESRFYLEKFEMMTEAGNFEKMILLFEILNKLACSNDFTILSNSGFTDDFAETEMDKINKVYRYLFNNYRQEISLKQVADMANMTPTSFSRYFKKKTTKSFVSVLIELRLGYACRLLQESDLTVLQVCDESGFNNMANFTQHFKEKFRESPIEYRKKFRI